MYRFLLILFLFPLFLTGCGDELPPEKVIMPPSRRPPLKAADASADGKIAKKFVYRGDKYRDPFVPLTGEGMVFGGSEEVNVPQVGGLALKGIIKEGKQKIALISGGGISYTLQNSRLYDSKQRLVKGITGIIKEESVVIIAPDKTTKELKLRNRER
ncbi:MAG: hypothetical protein JW803_03335 [Endomicrobiales bacterium]|nr:hypothetical protein [Endomicrobiales bacterium]